MLSEARSCLDLVELINATEHMLYHGTVARRYKYMFSTSAKGISCVCTLQGCSLSNISSPHTHIWPAAPWDTFTIPMDYIRSIQSYGYNYQWRCRGVVQLLLHANWAIAKDHKYTFINSVHAACGVLSVTVFAVQRFQPPLHLSRGVIDYVCNAYGHLQSIQIWHGVVG